MGPKLALELCYLGWWRHDTETLSALLPLCRRANYMSSVDFQWLGIHAISSNNVDWDICSRMASHSQGQLCNVCNDVTRPQWHENDVIMGAIASQITSLTSVYSIVYSDADQRKHQSSASLAFVRGIHRGPVNSPHKWPVMRKMFPFDDVIMSLRCISMFHWYQFCQCSSWPYDVIGRHWATMCAPSSPLQRCHVYLRCPKPMTLYISPISNKKLKSAVCPYLMGAMWANVDQNLWHHSISRAQRVKITMAFRYIIIVV